MTNDELIGFLAMHDHAVESRLGPSGEPRSSYVGIAVTADAQVILNCFKTSRKYHDLQRDPRIALVVGWQDAQTVQLEGVADFPSGVELDALRERYLAVHPDATRGPDIAYIRIRPAWARCSDFRGDEPEVHDLTFERPA